MGFLLGWFKEERDRHIKRYKNPENKVFYNLAQIWLFSDNLPYDENNPNQGAFYSASYSPIFQRFVEADKLDITPPPEKIIKIINRLKKFKKAS
ncbi:hypothetical protein HpMS258_00160 [Helicobacter pylori]